MTRRWIALALVLGIPALQAADPAAPVDTPTVLIVVGAPGEAEFGTNFSQQAATWIATCQQAGARHLAVGGDPTPGTNDLDTLRQTLGRQPTDGPAALWLVLLGHGTFDGKEARFNLRGPDLSATDLALALQPFHRPVAVINAASASAPFLAPLSGTNRVVVTATRSGHEQNYARFGEYLARAIADPQGDLDQDGQTSLLEAFLRASYDVAEFYRTEGRLATEHALIDDNGDHLGTPAAWFRGVRAVQKAKDGLSPDGSRAHQFVLVRSAAEQGLSPQARARRDELEQAVERLRAEKSRSSEQDYYRQLETLLLEIARLQPPPLASPAQTPP